MRCPDCNKFVGMENGDPEVDSIDIDVASLKETGEVVISAEVSMVRNCADCGTELKRWSGQTEELQDTVTAKHREHDLEIESDDGSADESGGGRYAKNIITAAIPFTVTCSCGEKIFEGELKAEAAAGEFEESC